MSSPATPRELRGAGQASRATALPSKRRMVTQSIGDPALQVRSRVGGTDQQREELGSPPSGPPLPRVGSTAPESAMGMVATEEER